MKLKSIQLFLGSFVFILFTSVYCERDYSCSALVLDQNTQLPVDSAWVRYANGYSITNNSGEFCIQFSTSKGNSIEIEKEGYMDKFINHCTIEDTIYLEQ
jgi:hypothetical protein